MAREDLNALSRRESTLLCVAAQLHALGAGPERLAAATSRLALDSSRELVREMVAGEDSSLARWAASL